MQYYSTQYDSPVGALTIVSDGRNITSVWMETQKPRITAPMQAGDTIAVLQQAARWLDDYFSGQRPKISDLPLNAAGTNFQQAVWQRLCRIPYGQTLTYGQIASEIAAQRGISSMSAQAVGQAVGSNPIAIIVPCHRVLGTSGKLTGYAGGIDRKVWLLHHEGIGL